MKKVATQLVEEKVLEGQKKLEEALIRFVYAVLCFVLLDCSL